MDKITKAWIITGAVTLGIAVISVALIVGLNSYNNSMMEIEESSSEVVQEVAPESSSEVQQEQPKQEVKEEVKQEKQEEPKTVYEEDVKSPYVEYPEPDEYVASSSSEQPKQQQTTQQQTQQTTSSHPKPGDTKIVDGVEYGYDALFGWTRASKGESISAPALGQGEVIGY